MAKKIIGGLLLATLFFLFLKIGLEREEERLIEEKQNWIEQGYPIQD